MAITVIVSLISLSASFNINPYAISSLATKKHIINLIYENAGKSSFSFYAYSSAIYTYDFDYLTGWLGGKKYKKLPEPDINKADFVYLIIPETQEKTKLDFINYKTPNENYTTTGEWKIPDGTVILKREKIAQF